MHGVTRIPEAPGGSRGVTGCRTDCGNRGNAIHDPMEWTASPPRFREGLLRGTREDQVREGPEVDCVEGSTHARLRRRMRRFQERAAARQAKRSQDGPWVDRVDGSTHGRLRRRMRRFQERAAARQAKRSQDGPWVDNGKGSRYARLRRRMRRFQERAAARQAKRSQDGPFCAQDGTLRWKWTCFQPAANRFQIRVSSLATVTGLPEGSSFCTSRT